ncbi:hypothetical protein SBRCBS47491_005841 [Sporothrix bragantina]|uniref:F-box domain-containing protein n=1 Tax=Sporothrix bragantina TaxID=671064 RepID=A0ABP0C038_9PEZI
MASPDTAAGPSLAHGLATDPLARLPIELLLRITRHLNTTDLCAVRLTSRTLERALFHSFSHEFFRRKQFMLTDLSLQALIDIAQHPAFSQTLRHVSIGLEKFSLAPIQDFRTPEQAIAFQTGAAQQQSLFMTGRGVQLLATAFALLPNLETVDIRDFYSHTRYRDGAYVPWRSYGLQRTQESMDDVTSQTLLSAGQDTAFPSQAFALVVAALAQANARPRNLEVMLRSRTHGLTGAAFDLTSFSGVPNDTTDASSPPQVPTLGVLAGLRRLHLDLQFTQQAGWGTRLSAADFRGNRFQEVSVAGLPLHAWLAHCPEIEWLRLNLQFANGPRGSIFLDALGAPLPAAYPFTTSPSASPDITMPFASRLRRFEIGRTACSYKSLMGVLKRMPALEHLALWHVTLACPAGGEENPRSIWNKFFGALAQDPLGSQLRHVSLLSLRVDDSPGSHSHSTHGVSFDGKFDAEHTAALEEPMLGWLRVMCAIAHTMIPEPNAPADDEEGDSEDEESEGEEDGDEQDESEEQDAGGGGDGENQATQDGQDGQTSHTVQDGQAGQDGQDSAMTDGA